MLVEDFLPAGAGAFQQWSNTSPPGTPQWAAVQDAAGPDQDASFCGSVAAGSIMSAICERRYRPEQIAAVHWVTARATARRLAFSDPDTAFAYQIRSVGIVVESPVVAIDVDYMTVDGSAKTLDWTWRWDRDPATGQPWTVLGALDAEVAIVDRSTALGAYGIRVSTLRKVIALTRSRVSAALELRI